MGSFFCVSFLKLTIIESMLINVIVQYNMVDKIQLYL